MTRPTGMAEGKFFHVSHDFDFEQNVNRGGEWVEDFSSDSLAGK